MVTTRKKPKIPPAVTVQGEKQARYTEATISSVYGARYLDARTSRWISADPALGEYVPLAPLGDEEKKHNQNLPGMGGVFNIVNLHVYHYAANNPVKYVDPDGRDIYFIGDDIEEAVNYLYDNSNSFKTNLNKLLNNVNNLGERLIVYFVDMECNYPGLTQAQNGSSTISNSRTLTIDENGNKSFGSLQIREEIQYIQITIDTAKIRNRNLNLLEVVTEEVMHAVDAASMGTTRYNEAIEREKRFFRYGNGPLEKSAMYRTQRVLEEL